MVKVVYTRQDAVIRLAETGDVFETHKSIAQAKRWSRTFQKANGGLGCGVLRVVESRRRSHNVISLDRDEVRRRKRDRIQVIVPKAQPVNPAVAVEQKRPQLRRQRAVRP